MYAYSSKWVKVNSVLHMHDLYTVLFVSINIILLYKLLETAVNVPSIKKWI